MTVRAISLSLASLLAVSLFAGDALADHHRRRHIVVGEDYYPGPPVLRHIPGVRIFFGDYALSEEEFDALYGDDNGEFDESYYEPEPAPPPRRKPAERPLAGQPAEKSPGAAVKTVPPKAPAAGTAAAGGTRKPAQQQTASAAPTPSSSSGLSCEKAASVVTGYGFSGVTAASCAGKVYAFNATRDGKNFAIKLDAKSGELTEVKKLP